jgi:glycosyltransferase involved in cell wall biosynthesis
VKVSVLVPAYNEAGAIRATVERIVSTMKETGLEFETIVIDDGSADETADQAVAAGVRVIRHPANGGYGRALKTGLRGASGDWIAIVDADGSYPIEQLPRLLPHVPQFDMIVGARTGVHYRGSIFKGWGRRILGRMVHFVAGVQVPDVNSGMRVFRRDIAIANIDRIGNGFSFTTTLTLAMLLQGHFVQYVPIDYLARVGRSKVRMSRDTLRMLQILVMAVVSYNPIKLFLLLTYVQALALVPCLLADVLLAGGVHVGLICAIGSASGLLLFAIGLTTDVLRRLLHS